MVAGSGRGTATIAESTADVFLRALHRLARSKTLSADDLLDARDELADCFEIMMDEAARRARED